MKIIKNSLIMLVFMSCQTQKLSPETYLANVRNSSLKLYDEKNIGDYIFRVDYKPLEIVALQECEQDYSRLKDELNKAKDEQYYSLEISMKDRKTDVLKYNAESKSEYSRRIEYFLSEFQAEITLTDGNESLPCNLYLYERDYGLSPFQKFQLGFPKGKNTKKRSRKTLVVNDELLTGEVIKLSIENSQIAKLPHLKSSNK